MRSTLEAYSNIPYPTFHLSHIQLRGFWIGGWLFRLSKVNALKVREEDLTEIDFTQVDIIIAAIDMTNEQLMIAEVD